MPEARALEIVSNMMEIVGVIPLQDIAQASGPQS
jgi:hypothetical protein